MAGPGDIIKEQCLKFQELATGFLSLKDGKSEVSRQKINIFFDELNAVAFKNFVFMNCDAVSQTAVQVVRQCCLVVAPTDSLLVAKGCQLISNLVSRQQLQLDVETARLSLAWCIEALHVCTDIALLDVLQAIELLLRAHAHRPDQVEELVGSLRRLLRDDWGAMLACKRDVRLAAVQCLEALTDGLEECWLEDIAAIFLGQLQAEEPADQDQLQLCKLLVSALKGLRGSLCRSQSLLHQLLGDSLGCVKAYMLHGLPGHTGLRPQRMFPSLLAQADTSLPLLVQCDLHTKKTIRLRKGRGSGPKKKSEGVSEDVSSLPASMNSFRRFTSEEGLSDGHSSPSATWPRTSDSEFSDSEGRQVVKLREAQARVRQAALSLMLTITKTCDKKVLFGYWPGLLPDGTSGLHTRTLATCLLKDSSPRCRLAVTDILVNLLPGSRPFLLHAQASDKEAAFTSFSVAVGYMVQELHRCLCLAAVAENSLSVLVPLLRCLAALVQNTPYHRLPTFLVPRVVSVAHNFLHHRDTKVQVASLTVLGSLVALDHSTPEIETALLGEDGDRCWLLELCLKLPGQAACPVPIRVEALQLLAALATSYFTSAVLTGLQPTLQLLHTALGDPDPAVCLHAARALDAICAAMQRASHEPESGVDAVMLVQFWEGLLSGPLLLMLQSPDHVALRAVGCDCLASLDEATFLLLQPERHTLIIALLLGCSRDEPHVKASAVRALSICVLFRLLREDMHFVLDTAEAVTSCLQDELLAVRMKASWSLANLCDALVLNASQDGVQDAPTSLLTQLIQCGITAAKDNEKVRCNAVRALGNLLQIVGADALETGSIRELVSQAVQSLVHNATSGSNMKVCWNACYAMGNLLKNQAMYAAHWQGEVFSVLMTLVQDSKNFKVRISAALALGVPTSRTAYGKHYLPSWMALLQGLAHTDCAEAFSEYQHRDQLVDQLCLSLCHLTLLLTVEDLVPLQGLLTTHADTLQQHLVQLCSRANPDKLLTLEQAAGHSLAVLQEPSLSTEQHRAAALLAAAFLQDN